MACRPIVVPYVSTYGQLWEDVVIVRFDPAEPHETPIDWTSLLGQALPPKTVEPSINARAVYVRSFCRCQVVDGATKCPRSDSTQAPKSSPRWIGASAPSGEWLNDLFPELALVGDFRQTRVSKGQDVHSTIRQQHQDCLYKECLWRQTEKPRNASKRRMIDISSPRPLLFVRIHLRPMVYDYPPLRPPLLTIPLCSCGCASAAAIVKPPNLPAEPHVSNAIHCVSEQISGFLPEFRAFHPAHRLDCWVGGAMIVWAKVSSQKCTLRSPKAKVELTDKVYEAISPGTASDALTCLRLHCGDPTFPFSLKTFMPPSNLFDRSYPLPSSTVQVDGWKACETLIDSCNAISGEILRATLRRNLEAACEPLEREWFERIIQTISNDNEYVKWSIRIPTGRRQQIRSALALLGFPVLFDEQYSALSGYHDVNDEELRRCSALHLAQKVEKQAQLSIYVRQLRDEIQKMPEGGDVRDGRAERILSTDPITQSPSDTLLSIMDRAGKISKPLGLWAKQVTVRVDAVPHIIGPVPPWWVEGGKFA